MTEECSQTLLSLKRWNDGDPQGLEALIERHLPWIHAHVRKRLGMKLRKKTESSDVVQDAMVQFLKYGPRIAVNSDASFRALLIRIVENALRDRNDWFRAKRRAASVERPIASDTVLYIDPPKEQVKTPSVGVQKNEREAWIRLGLELLSPDDRRIIILRQWESLPFKEIAIQLDITAEAARMRHNRAVGRLSEQIGSMRRGDQAAGHEQANN